MRFSNPLHLLALLLPLLTLTSATPSAASPSSIRALFLFKDVLKSNTTAIKTSGFNTLLIFGIGILSDGSIKYYSNTPGSSDIVIASGGSYVGGPALSDKVRSFKTGATGVDRVEISMNSQNVKSLMGSNSGVDSAVARNFKALKEAWGLDAVNNDDESIYDVASTVLFAKMLGRVGYKYTGAPYTNGKFWKELVGQGNKGLKEETRLVDRMYLQCYDGGARNEPKQWERELGMGVVPLVWVTNDSKPGQGVNARQAGERFTGWVGRGGVVGGGYWNDYDIEKMKLSYGEYGAVLKGLWP